jgi:hypothetical protein
MEVCIGIGHGRVLFARGVYVFEPSTLSSNCFRRQYWKKCGMVKRFRDESWDTSGTKSITLIMFRIFNVVTAGSCRLSLGTAIFQI